MGRSLPRRRFWFPWGVALCVVMEVNFGDIKAAENLAQGAAYIYSPSALYRLTRDDGDAYQLTDGATVTDWATMWMSRKAVGWLAGSRPIDIEIDLGKARAIGSICLRIARRTEAGVSFPGRVDVFTSPIPGRYAWAGDIMAGRPAEEGPYLVKRVCLDGLFLQASQVRLLVFFRGRYFFTDEIEVLPPTNATPGAEPPFHMPPLAAAELRAFVQEHEAVSRTLADLPLPSGFGAAEQLRRVAAKLQDHSGTLGFQELAELDQAIRQALREGRAKAGHKFSVYATDPWRLVAPVGASPPALAQPGVDLPAGGHGVAALTIEHPQERPLRISVTAEWAEGGADAPAIGLYEVASVTRADGVRLGDPLLPLREGGVEVATGESKQLWIDLVAPVRAAGIRMLRIRLGGMLEGRLVSRSLEIPVRVWTVPPLMPPPATVVWGYLNSPPIRGLANEAAADMLAHGVNTAVLPAADLPWPSPGGGNGIGDYRRFDAVMEALKGHRQYLFFLSFNTDSAVRTFGGRHQFLSDSWKALFTAWIKEWTAHLALLGIGYEAFALYPVDEPHAGVEQETLAAVAQLIKAADPRIRVYTTLHRPETLDDGLAEAIDIFQLNGAALSPELAAKLQGLGKQVWAYSTPDQHSSGKALSPAGFYRAQAWQAFIMDLGGFGFWAYADMGQIGSAWNDIDDERPDFTVIYEGKSGIVSSKRWEAWREGVQDYAILSAALANARTESGREAVRSLAAAGYASIGDFEVFSNIRRALLEFASTESGKVRQGSPPRGLPEKPGGFP